MLDAGGGGSRQLSWVRPPLPQRLRRCGTFPPTSLRSWGDQQEVGGGGSRQLSWVRPPYASLRLRYFPPNVAALLGGSTGGFPPLGVGGLARAGDSGLNGALARRVMLVA